MTGPERELPRSAACQMEALWDAARARGMLVAIYGESEDWPERGLEFRDRLGRYACLRSPDMWQETADWVFEQLSELGLDVRTNQDLAPSEHQLSLNL
jgi:hypothetical protein